jgi:peptidyl-prolyl cis-trans isomerase A (cyclophilin A)
MNNRIALAFSALALLTATPAAAQTTTGQAPPAPVTHEAGSLLMANLGPGTARSDFFITLGPIPGFKDSFALFGRVVEGMDAVKAIFASPVDPDKGAGPMRGQMLTPAIRIRTARVVPKA